jgi:hypothetical protein
MKRLPIEPSSLILSLGHMLPELEIVKTKSGLFCLFKNDGLIGKSLRDVGSFAEKEAHLAITLAKGRPGCLVLDIGANLGAFAIPVARELLAQHPKHPLNTSEFSR